MSESDKPKYLILKEALIEKITNKTLMPGDKIQSENELALDYKISRHTVRQALGEMVNEGWLYKVQGKGTYVSDKNSFTNERKTVAIIISYLNDYIFPSIISGMERVLSSLGINILLSCTDNLHEKERQSLENIRYQKIDALIVEPTKGAYENPNLDIYKELQDKKIPILFIHGSYDKLKTSYVIQDDELAGVIATKHLIKLGHKNIGGIFKTDYKQGHLRYSGYSKAHKEENLLLDINNVVWFESLEEVENTTSSAYAQILRIIKTCSALVCYNDQVAQRVLDIARKYDILIPQDISIVSFDDSEMAVASEVKLTTVAHPKERLGEEAALATLKLMNKSTDRITEVMKPELVIRESTQNIFRGDRNE